MIGIVITLYESVASTCALGVPVHNRVLVKQQ